MGEPENLEPTLPAAQRRTLAVGLLNHVWALPGTPDRSREQDDEVIHAAHASRSHRGEVGTAANLGRGGILEDRRGVVVEITERGRALWEQAVVAQAGKESIGSATLTDGEQDQLDDLLRRLVIAFRDEYGPLSKRRA